MRVRLWLIPLVAAVLLASTAAWAIEDEAYEAALIQQLQKLDPDQVDRFRQANQAREAKDLQRASSLYDQVRARVPAFSAATRRMCGVESELGHRDDAIKLCREALRREDLPENKSALARTLLHMPNEQDKPTSNELGEALRLSAEAALVKRDDLFANVVHCEAALRSNDLKGMKWCSSRMKVIAPKEPITHMVLAIVEASEGRFEQGLEALEEAHRLGLPDRDYKHLKGAIEDARPASETLVPLALRTGVSWVAGLLVLLGLGVLLSRATLASVSRLPATQDGAAQGTDRLLRKLYRVVLWVCCAYYYVSLPIVMLFVVVAGGGTLYAFLALGRIPIKLVLLIVIVVFVTLWAMLKSLFVRGTDEDPGERLDLEEHPRLRDLLREVAARVGTRMVDKVFVTPGTEVAVFERGDMLRQLTGRAERCLVIGAGALEGMKGLELKAVLAHEYGHFQNDDTAGGGFALAVRRSLLTMAMGLARGGAAAWYNPAWLFLNAFHRIFLRISQGASRLQEVLADRWAAFSYGSEAFERGLVHIIRRSVGFDHHVDRTLHEVIKDKRPLANLYSYKPADTSEDAPDIEKAIEEVLHRKPSPYDSHPAPDDRLKLVRALQATGKGASEGDDDPAWSLFANREEIERRMTDDVRIQLSVRNGIVIRATE